MGKRGFRSRNKRALSPIFATMILAAIVIVFGSIAYYFANNLTTTTTNNYLSTLSNSQQAIAERIGFENVQYISSSHTLEVYIINCGIANDVKINSVFIYDANNIIVGQPYSGNSITALQPIISSTPTPTPLTGNDLNVGQEGYFTIIGVTQSNGQPLVSGSIYTIHLVTKSEGSFDYEFTA